MTDQLLHNTLKAIFILSRASLPVDASAVAQVVGTSPMRIAEALVVLEQRGWVDASRARLTMLGLAKAVAGGIPQTRAVVQPSKPARASSASTRRGRGRVPGDRRPSVIPSELPIAAAPRVHH